LIERFRAALTKRGARGIIGLQRQFKIADDDGSGFLNQVEFVKCIKDFGVQIEDQDIISLFKSMDTDNSGEISFDEFLRVYVGDMNAFRVSLVEKAYKTLDFNNDGQVSMEEFKMKYNAQQHPDVRTGKRTEDEVLTEFMETFETHYA
jgi:Ca2+-binding EF-hand superfamily protein